MAVLNIVYQYNINAFKRSHSALLRICQLNYQPNGDKRPNKSFIIVTGEQFLYVNHTVSVNWL